MMSFSTRVIKLFSHMLLSLVMDDQARLVNSDKLARHFLEISQQRVSEDV